MPKEVRDQLKHLRNDKAADAEGINTEMIKYGGEAMIEAIAEILDDVMQCKGGEATSTI